MKGRILVVDDDRLVLATVTHGLQQAGYEVIDADNGDDAILLARHHRPNLALLDIRMEGKTGFDVAAYLRDVSRVPFMFLSAFNDEQTLRQARELGAVSYLVKPLDVAQIVPEVDAAMDRLRKGSLPQPTGEASESTAGATPALDSPNHPASGGDSTTPLPRSGGDVGADRALDAVAVAVGIVMHRYSLDRDQALMRLSKLAVEQQISLSAQAGRIVSAVEELARTSL